MFRAQILLRPDQHLRLLRLSEEEGKSVSEITRTLLDEALAAHQTAAWRGRSRAINDLRALRRSIEGRGTPEERDLVDEARVEREAQRPWR